MSEHRCQTSSSLPSLYLSPWLATISPYCLHLHLHLHLHLNLNLHTTISTTRSLFHTIFNPHNMEVSRGLAKVTGVIQRLSFTRQLGPQLGPQQLAAQQQAPVINQLGPHQQAPVTDQPGPQQAPGLDQPDLQQAPG